jgi:hypothetical protein
VAHTQAFDQDRLDEDLGGERRKAFVEVHDAGAAAKSKLSAKEKRIILEQVVFRNFER